MIVGLSDPDDAGVYKIDKDRALVQTLDFLTPVTDSPYEFGQIAAANSLSDVYAMGADPLTVMNIVCFPDCDLDDSILAQTLKGGVDKINESGAALVGGHSVDDPEFKYGLSVTGMVHPDKILTNNSAGTGDVIVLTKPVGTGVMSTAIKAKIAKKDDIRQAVKVMSLLNKKAKESLSNFNVSACTDVTGFGLAGHLMEMARGSKKEMELFVDKVPLLDNVRVFASMGMIPGGTHKNRRFFEPWLHIDKGVQREMVDLVFDPQTSGGLLISLDEDQGRKLVDQMHANDQDAWIIGRVTRDSDKGFLVIN